MSSIISLVLLMLSQLLMNSYMKEMTPSVCLLLLYIFSYYSSFGSELFFMDEYSKNMIMLSMFMYISMSMMFNEKGKMISVLLTFLIIMMFFLSSSYLMMFITFESSLLPVMLIMYMYGGQPERIGAIRYMMMYTTLASIPMLIIIINMMSEDKLLIVSQQWVEGVFVSWPVLLGLITAFLIKIPMFMTHTWLPKAHVEAPVEGSMILAGVMLKMGVFGIIRMMTVFYSSSLMKNSLMMIFLLGSIISCWVSVSVDDMKMNVAFSSISHMNFMMAGLMTSKVLAIKSCILIMISHGLSSALLFFLVTSFYYSTNSRSFIVSKGGMSLFPVMTMFMFLSWVINMACPPSIPFIGELMCISSLLSYCVIVLPLVMIFIIINSFFCIFSFGVMSHSNSKVQFKGYINSTSSKLIACSFLMPLVLMFISLEMIM